MAKAKKEVVPPTELEEKLYAIASSEYDRRKVSLPPYSVSPEARKRRAMAKLTLIRECVQHALRSSRVTCGEEVFGRLMGMFSSRRPHPKHQKMLAVESNHYGDDLDVVFAESPRGFHATPLGRYTPLPRNFTTRFHRDAELREFNLTKGIPEDDL